MVSIKITDRCLCVLFIVTRSVCSTSLFQDPINDGGQWDMAVNLINKYGLMPKKCFPESFSCESSLRMNTILKSKVSLIRIRYGPVP
jgi:aminopeptidase C